MTSQIPPEATMKAALQAYVDRINAGDLEGVLALFAPGAVIEDPVGSPPKTGEDLPRWFADTMAFDTRITPVAPIRGSHGNAALVVFDVAFTPPGAKRMRIRSADVCTFDAAGLITTLHGYWGPGDIALAPDGADGP